MPQLPTSFLKRRRDELGVEKFARLYPDQAEQLRSAEGPSAMVGPPSLLPPSASQAPSPAPNNPLDSFGLLDTFNASGGLPFGQTQRERPLAASRVIPGGVTDARTESEARAQRAAASESANNIRDIAAFPGGLDRFNDELSAERLGTPGLTSLEKGKVTLVEHLFNVMGASSFAGNRFVLEALGRGTPIGEATSMAMDEFVGALAGDEESEVLQRVGGVDILMHAFDDDEVEGFFQSAGYFVGGLALDILLDPVTYIPGGLLTKLGKVESVAPLVRGISETAQPLRNAAGAVGSAVRTAPGIKQLRVKFGPQALVKGLAKGDEAQALAEWMNKAELEMVERGILPEAVTRGAGDLSQGAGAFLAQRAHMHRARAGADRQLNAALRQFVSGLSEKEYIPLLMYLDQPKNLQPIAKALSLGDGAVEASMMDRAGKLRRVLREMGEEEMDAGVLSPRGLRETYLPGVGPQTDAAKQLDEVLTRIRAGDNFKMVQEQRAIGELIPHTRPVQGANGLPYFVFGKKYPTREARVVAATPTDLTIGGVAKRGYDHTRLMTTTNFINGVLSNRNIAIPIDAAKADSDAWIKGLAKEGLGVYKLPGKTFDEAGQAVVHDVSYVMPKQFVDELEAADGIFRGNKAPRQAYKAAMSVWKSYALFSVGYHVRNVMSNVSQNFIGGVDVTWLTDPRAYAQTALLQAGDVSNIGRGRRQAVELFLGGKKNRRELEYTNAQGERINGEDLFNEMHDRGIIGTGQTAVESGAGFRAAIADLTDGVKANVQDKGMIDPLAKWDDFVPGWGSSEARRQRVSSEIVQGLTRRKGGRGSVKISDEEADDLALLFDAQAKTWAWNNGLSPDEWYERYLFGFGELAPDNPQPLINKLAKESEAIIGKKRRFPSRKTLNRKKKEAAEIDSRLTDLDEEMQQVSLRHDLLQERADHIEEALTRPAPRHPGEPRVRSGGSHNERKAQFTKERKRLENWRKTMGNRRRRIRAHFDELENLNAEIRRTAGDRHVAQVQQEGLKKRRPKVQTEAEFRKEKARVEANIKRDMKQLEALEGQMVELEKLRPTAIDRLEDTNGRMLMLQDGRALIKASREGKSSDVIQLMGRMAMRQADEHTTRSVETWLLGGKLAEARAVKRSSGEEVPHLFDLPNGQVHANKFGKGFLLMVQEGNFRPGATVTTPGGVPAGMNKAVQSAIEGLGKEVRQQVQMGDLARETTAKVIQPTKAQQAKAARISSEPVAQPGGLGLPEQRRPKSEFSEDDVAELQDLANQAAVRSPLTKAVKDDIGRLFGTGMDANAENLELIKQLQSAVDAVGVENAQLGKRIVGAAKAPLDVNNRLLTASRRVGTALENDARAIHFIDKWRKTGSFDAAEESTKKYLFDYNELTEWERNNMKDLLPFYCVPDTYEILTRDGWKGVDDLEPGVTEVLVYEHERDTTVWEPLDDVATFDYNGQMFRLGGETGSWICTPDHGWPVVDHTGQRQMKKAWELRSNHKIPMVAGSHEYDGHPAVSPRMAAIMGWLLTDGTMRTRGAHVEMAIYQSPKKFLSEILELVGEDAHPAEPHPDTGVVKVQIVGETRAAIQELMPDKSFGPLVATRLTEEAALAMADAMYLADGTVSKKRKGDFFSATQQAVFDTFQILMLQAGHSCQQGPRGGYVSRGQRHLKVAGAMRVTNYTGRIWCPQLKNRCWYMRNEQGKVILSQNTWMRKNIPLQIEAAARAVTPFGGGPGLYKVADKRRVIGGLSFGGNRYRTFQRFQETFEDLSQDLEDVPEYDYFREINALRTPWELSGQPVFVSPDLPFNDLNRALSWRDYAASITPAARLIAPTLLGKSVGSVDPLTGAEVKPDALARGLGEDLGLTRPQESSLETILPPLGQVSRTVAAARRGELFEGLLRLAGTGARTLDADEAVNRRVQQVRTVSRDVKQALEGELKRNLRRARTAKAKQFKKD